MFPDPRAVRLFDRRDATADAESDCKGNAVPDASQRTKMHPAADRGARPDQSRRSAAVSQRPQGRDVVKDPERPPVRTGNQIITLDLEIVDRDHRQAAGMPRPTLPSSRLKNTPVSVPTNSRPCRTGSARITRVISPAGKSPLIDRQLLPESVL